MAERSGRRWTLLLTVMAAVLISVPTAVWASHQFTDVPNNHTFHAAITWMKDNGITVGCNPPANTQYCPEDNVTRGQISAFMKRLAENRVVDAATLQGLGAEEIVSAYADSGPFGSTQVLAGIGKLEEVEVTTPRDGFLQILASASTFELGVSTTLVWVQVDNTTCNNSTANISSVGFGYSSTAAANARAGTAFAEGYVAVTPGPHTISLCGNQFAGGNVDVLGPSISALFLDNVTMTPGLHSSSGGSIPGSSD